ncbi:histidine phosphatase family protein [Corynebacteriaceae bacterium 7-707]
MRRLVVVTHPEATHHVDELVGGWYDSALTGRGRRQADRVADALGGLTGVEIVSSDLTRCRETAAPLAEKLGCDVRYLSALREKSYGSGEGRPDAWFRERYAPPPADGDRLGHDEGLHAETLGDFARRVYAGMDEVVGSARHGTTVVVTHGGSATMVIAHWLRLPVEALGHARFRVTPGSITELQEDDYFHNRTLVRLNDTSHLDGV